MSSPDPKVPEMSSGSFDVSGTETPAKSHEQDMRRRRRETQQSPFKIPDNNSIFLLNVNEKGVHKEEKHRFLTLPIDEKTTHTSHKMAKLKSEVVGELEEQEKKDKIKNPKYIKSKTALPKRTSGRHELKMAMMKRENTTKESKHDLISMERQKAVLELELTTKRSEILRMQQAVAKAQGRLKQLEKLIERDNLNFEVLLRHHEKKSVEARTW
ncbi:uncharacterized protein LOC113144556 [Mastacembelus armatus]|uniref:uncharacterized protein LOC113144556 n=1 Tax=Mastacembelus armatus TaxID=205130 RepID=UPI000E4564E9|nr:uncharacterized protein LOC113144556 [Mastacembelus armatus]